MDYSKNWLLTWLLVLLAVIAVSNPLQLRAETAPPEIAISLDDAPMPSTRLFNGLERTQTLIARLKEVNSPAVGVFAVGQHTQELPQGIQQLKLYAAAGHMIANHSYSHLRLGRVGSGVFIQDIQHADRMFRSLPNFKPFFRFPYLFEGNNIQEREAVLQALSSMGYREGYVTVTTYDFEINRLVNKALKNKQVVDYEKLKQVYLSILWDCIIFYDQMAFQVLGRPVKHVLLLHANDLAAYYIGDLITFIRSKGWKVIPIEEAYQDPIAQISLTTTMSQDGRIGAIAKEQKADYPVPYPPALSSAYIQKTLEEAKVFSLPEAAKQ